MRFPLRSFLFCRLLENVLESLREGLRRGSADCLVERFAIFREKLNVGNARHFEFARHFGIGRNVRVEIRPDELVVVRFHGIAGVDIFFVCLARWAPRRREYDKHRFAGLLGSCHSGGVVGDKLWAALGEVLCLGSDSERERCGDHRGADKCEETWSHGFIGLNSGTD